MDFYEVKTGFNSMAQDAQPPSLWATRTICHSKSKGVAPSAHLGSGCIGAWQKSLHTQNTPTRGTEAMGTASTEGELEEPLEQAGLGEGGFGPKINA
jgi:hypothetical protein